MQHELFFASGAEIVELVGHLLDGCVVLARLHALRLQLVFIQGRGVVLGGVVERASHRHKMLVLLDLLLKHLPQLRLNLL